MLQNLGHSHFIVGRDHAGVGTYYDSFASQDYLAERTGLAIEIINAPTQWYCRECGGTTNSEDCPHGEPNVSHYKGRELREMLKDEIEPDLGTILPADLCDFISDKLGQRRAGTPIKFFNDDESQL